MDYAQAIEEQARFMGLLEDNEDYSYLTSVLPVYDPDGEIDRWFVGVAWYAVRMNDKGEFDEFGNVLMVDHPGKPVDAIKQMIHNSYLNTMAKAGQG